MSNPLTTHNLLYTHSLFLLRRKDDKRYDSPRCPVDLARARRFVMPYGRYIGYYAGAVARHDPDYLIWLYSDLVCRETEGAFDADRIRLTDVIRALRKGGDLGNAADSSVRTARQVWADAGRAGNEGSAAEPSDLPAPEAVRD